MVGENNTGNQEEKAKAAMVFDASVKPVALFGAVATPSTKRLLDSPLTLSPSSSFTDSDSSIYCFRGPQRVELIENPKNPDSPAGKESLMVTNRQVNQVDVAGSTVFVDCPRLPLGEVEALKNKAIQLELHYLVKNNAGPNAGAVANGGDHKTYVGQAGIIVAGNEKTLYTARHNVVADEEKDGHNKVFDFAYARAHSIQCLAIIKQSNYKLNKKTEPLLLHPRDSECNWKYGWDVATGFPGNLNPRVPLKDMEADNMFEMVRPDFKYEIGQRVGIVVSSAGLTDAATPENANVARLAHSEWYAGIETATEHQWSGIVSEDEMKEKKREAMMKALEGIYGPGNAVAIYTGVITYVGTHHIEYDINTFKSCSGATVFLLPVDGQPASVKPQDRGKGIGVHVGFNELLGDRGSNLGLRLHRSWWHEPAKRAAAVLWLLANIGAFAYCSR